MIFYNFLFLYVPIYILSCLVLVPCHKHPSRFGNKFQRCKAKHDFSRIPCQCCFLPCLKACSQRHLFFLSKWIPENIFPFLHHHGISSLLKLSSQCLTFHGKCLLRSCQTAA